jgi:hypothetical protein
MTRVLLALALAFGAFVPVQAAGGQTLSPSLTGEFLSSTTVATITDFDCDDTGGSLSFSAAGIAAGPYPGTFTETGTVTLGPRDIPIPGMPGQFVAPILSFEAEFTITSVLGTVMGSKTMTAPSDANVGFCTPSLGGDPNMAQIIASVLRYEATLPDGSTDQGSSFANFNASSEPPAPAPPQLEFREGFTSDEAILVVLTPPTETNTVGSEHTVTATATTLTGSPAEGTTILFTVEGASDASGACTTDDQGQCAFTYTGPALPGADVITGCADNDESGSVDLGEPCGEATKIWMLPATTPGQVTGGGWIVVGGERVSFGFNAQSRKVGDPARGNCNVIDHATTMHIKCLTVDSLVVSPTHATFFGQATVDDVPTDYRIDVDDLGVADTFKIQTNSGYVAGGTLEGGNIQIHR